MTTAEIQEVAERHVQAENVRDLESALATYGDDCFYEVPALGLHLRGKEALALNYAGLFATFPDGEVIAEGHAFGPDVMVHWGRFEGTVLGTFMGLPATGRRVSLPFSAVFEFKDGLMRGERVFYDLATLCQQAGLPFDRVSEAARALSAALAQPTAGAETVLS